MMPTPLPGLAPSVDELVPTVGHDVPANSLVKEAQTLLRQTFSDHGHDPDEAQWRALTALLGTFDGIVAGSLATPALYLSALDPGVGKTSALVAYLTALLRSPEHDGIGVLICLSRLSEIKKLAERLLAAGGSVAVQCSDPALNELSNVEDPKSGQVLIITQQRLELIGQNRSLRDVASMAFRGKVRSLRVWDETFLPAQPIAVTTDDLSAVLRWLRPKSADFHAWVVGIQEKADNAEDGQVIGVPTHSFLDEQVTLNQALAPLRTMHTQGNNTLRDQDEATLVNLWSIAGRFVTVRKDGRFGPTLVSFRQTLPDDLLPLVVLDASARVRGTYSLMDKAMPVVRLPTATKSYDTLRINVWKRSGGKTAVRDKTNFPIIVDALRALVDDCDAGRKWLVVTHKPGPDFPDMEKNVGRRLGMRSNDVSYLTWGNHAATNDHANADRVVLAGTLFYRDSFYEALARASVLKGPDELPLGADTIDELKLGEHGHMVLQALCRASVRRASNGTSTACEAYLMASERSGILGLLPQLFPGCSVVPWEPQGPQLSARPKLVFDFLQTWAGSVPPGASIKFTEVYRHLMINPDVFRKHVRESQALKDMIKALGVREDGSGTKATRYLRVEKSGCVSL